MPLSIAGRLRGLIADQKRQGSRASARFLRVAGRTVKGGGITPPPDPAAVAPFHRPVPPRSPRSTFSQAIAPPDHFRLVSPANPH
jgi:hypothetical protein